MDTRLRGEYYLTLVLVLLALTTWFVHRFARSWTGLATEAMREEETAAGAMGISHVRFKILAFTIGSAMAGLGGVLYAHFVNFISPDDFGFPVSIMLLSMVVLGGMGKIWGPILGAIVLGSLPEVFRPWSSTECSSTALRSCWLSVISHRGSWERAAFYDGFSRGEAMTMAEKGMILRVEGMSRYFGGLKAVDDVSFHVSRGRSLA